MSKKATVIAVVNQKGGILLTMVDSRTNYSKDISNLIRENYGGKLKV